MRRYSHLSFGLIAICLLSSCHQMMYRNHELSAQVRIKEIKAAQQTYKNTKGRYGTLNELVEAKERSASQASCALIDKSRPAQFISYESASETASEVTLRLHNNTSCNIIVETDDRHPIRLSKTPNGGVKVETVTSSQDGVMLPLHYLVQDRQRRRVPEPAYGWGDSVFTYEILAGQSAVFTVPIARFRKSLDVVVPFNYAWESDRAIGMGVGGVIHRVYFLIEDLPEAVMRER